MLAGSRRLSSFLEKSCVFALLRFPSLIPPATRADCLFQVSRAPPLSYRKLQNLCLRARNSFCVQRGLRDGTEPWRPTGRWPPVSEWASVSFCTNLDVCGSGENSLFFQHVAKSGRLYVSDPHSALQSSLRTRGSRSRARSRVVQSRIRLPPPWLRQRRASFARPMAGRRFRSGH